MVRLSNCNESRGTLWWEVFLLRNICIFFFEFQTMSKNFPVFRRKIFSRFVKITIYIYRGTFRWLFCGKTKLRFIVFGFILQKLFQLLNEVFWQACQKCNLGFQGNILRKNTFFVVFIRKHSTSGKKIMAGLSKIHSTCP